MKILRLLSRAIRPAIYTTVVWVASCHFNADPNRIFATASSGFPCGKYDSVKVSNDIGQTIEVFALDCGFIGSAWQTFVFLLLPGQHPSDANLIMTYNGLFDGDDQPIIEWSQSSVKIRLTGYEHPWKTVTQLYGIKIVYDIPEPNKP